jgi:hypothetical protein
MRNGIGTNGIKMIDQYGTSKILYESRYDSHSLKYAGFEAAEDSKYPKPPKANPWA